MKKMILTFVLAISAVGWNASDATNSSLPSLCDQWNVLFSFMDNLTDYYYRTDTKRLTTDTIINDIRYVKMEEKGVYNVTKTEFVSYVGALREDDDAKIYFIPAESDHEYLLYAFHANVGDTFSNVWFGGDARWFPEGIYVTIKEITETTPRIFSLEYSTDGITYQGSARVRWIEGIGFPSTPDGDDCPPGCAGGGVEKLLCAYQNGEQVYTSEYGEEYGCEYNAEPIDITLYHAPNLNEWDGMTGVNQTSRDTLKTIEKTQVKAVLSGHYLYLWIAEVRAEINLFSITEQNNVYSSTYNAGDFSKDIHLQTPDSYMLVLKPENLEGVVLGRVDFETDSQDIRHIYTPASNNAVKYLRDGRLVIERDGKIYDATGAAVR